MVAGARVTAPDGTTWVVRRQWARRVATRALQARLAGRRRRRRRENGGWTWSEVAETATWLPEFDVVMILAVVAVVAVVVLGLFAVVVDVLVVAALVLGGGVARMLFRRPWTVEAVADSGERFTRQVVGWGASGRARDEIAAGLRHGQQPEELRPAEA